ncbi:transcription initiation factor TFIID subunit 4-like [Mastacembelus armatus]|uniref:transcription initiation factor TFIID subunit 4-like n=1 Tax=Mastacembelus armatus TaxID=205130 RepID=UPI000E46328A|nr:transcription initiation factor TFIID subunit 4-like [Mastacembelus armatus]
MVMATNHVVVETKRLESCSEAKHGDSSIQVKVLRVPAKGDSITVVQPTPSAVAVSKCDSTFAPPKVIPTGQDYQTTSSAVPGPRAQTSSPSIMVISKVATPGGVNANSQHVSKPPLSQVAPMAQATTPGKTVVITVPRTAGPQPNTVTPRLPQAASSHLPANIQIPSGMMLIHTDSGQLMFVSQQALAQAQQGSRVVSSEAPRILAPQEGKLEADEFTGHLYNELKSTPQPCLVPFLKKSIPAVRRLTADPRLFIQQASTATRNPNTLSSTIKQSITDTGPSLMTSQQVIQQPQRATVIPSPTSLAQSRNYTFKNSRFSPKHTVVQSGKHFTVQIFFFSFFFFLVHITLHFSLFIGTFSLKQDPPQSIKFAFKDSAGSYKEDDDINDVASMAGVNLREENAQILTTMVGSVVQSCYDQPFLSPKAMLSRILQIGQAMGITDVAPEVVALVSHATQECLRGLLENLSVMAQHRKATFKDDLWHVKASDVRSQLRFLEEVESLKKRRKDEEERETLLCLARSRSHTEDPQHQQLKQRAKELRQIEEAQLQQRETNLTALAAIGPRRKRTVEESQVGVCVLLLPRQGVQRMTRLMLRDLLLCMEQDHFLHHSLILYKAML